MRSAPLIGLTALWLPTFQLGCQHVQTVSAGLQGMLSVE
jgi:hypothetical protein